MSKNSNKLKDFKLPETEIATLKELEKMLGGELDFNVRDNHVVSLNLFKKGLTEIPKSISNLKKIESLYLGYNQIKVIPEFLKNLSSLKEIDVVGNLITKLPEWILKRIKQAKFPYNYFYDEGVILEIKAKHLIDPSKDLLIWIHISDGLPDCSTKDEKLPKELIKFLKFYFFEDLIKIADALKDILDPVEFYDYIDKLDKEKLKNLVKSPSDLNQINFIEGILQYLEVLDRPQDERWKIEGILKAIGSNYLDYLIDLIKNESPLRLSVLEAIIQSDSGKKEDVKGELQKRDFLFNFPIYEFQYHEYFFRLLNILSLYFTPREVISYLNEYHEKKLNSILKKEIRLDRKKNYHVIELIIYTILDYLDDFNYDQGIDEYEDEELCNTLATFKPIIMEPIIRFHLVGEGDIKQSVVKIAEFFGEEAKELLKIELKNDIEYVDLYDDEGHYSFGNLVDILKKYGDLKIFFKYLNGYKHLEEIFYPIWKEEYYPLLSITEFVIKGLKSTDSELSVEVNKFLHKILEMLEHLIVNMRDFSYTSYILYFLHAVINKTDQETVSKFIENLTEEEKDVFKKALKKLLETNKGEISLQDEKEICEEIIALISVSQRNNEKNLKNKFNSGYLPDIEYLIKNKYVKYDEVNLFIKNLKKISGIADFFGDSEELKTNPPQFIRDSLKVIIEKTDEKGLQELLENFLPYTPPERMVIPHTWETFVIENNFLNELSTEELIELIENDNFLPKLIRILESYKDKDIYFQEYIYEIIIKKSSNSINNVILRMVEDDNLDALYEIFKSGIFYSFKPEDFLSLMQNIQFLDKIILSRDNKPPVYYDNTYDSFGLDVLFSHVNKEVANSLYAFIDYLLEKSKFNQFLIVASYAFSSLEPDRIIPTLESNKINFLILIANNLDEIKKRNNWYSDDALDILRSCCYRLYKLCVKKESFKKFIIQNIIEVSEMDNMNAITIFIDGEFIEFIGDVPKDSIYKLIRNLIKAFDFLDRDNTIEEDYYELYDYIIRSFLKLIKERPDYRVYLKRAITDSIFEDPPRILLQFFDDLLFSRSILQIFEESDLVTLIKNPKFPKKVFEVIKLQTEEHIIDMDRAMDAIFLIFSIINDKLKVDSFNDVLNKVFVHMSTDLKEKLSEELLSIVNAGKEYDEFGMYDTFKKIWQKINQLYPRTIQSVKINNKEIFVYDDLLDLEFGFKPIQIADIEGFKELKNLRKISLRGCGIAEITSLDNHVNLEELNLSNNNISEIKGLLNLKNLKLLNLEYNNISEIQGIEHLTQLKTLILNKNKFKGTFELKNLGCLENLYLSNTDNFKNKNITSINIPEKLVNLRVLHLRNNKINDIKGLTNLRELRELNLSKNELSCIEGFKYLVNLEKINLEQNNIEDIREFKSLNNLKELKVNHNKLVKMNGVEKLGNLVSLDLSENNIEEINNLELENLKSLSLGSNKITKVKGLHKLEQLEELSLGSNQIDEIKGLDKMKSLKTLSLQYNQITEIKGLEKLENLQKLNLHNNKIKDIKGLEYLTNLKVLNLSHNQITEIKGLEKLENLVELWLDNNQLIEIKGLEMLKNLRRLSLCDNNLTEIKGLENLVNLNIFSIYRNQIPDEIKHKIGFSAQSYVRYCKQKR